MPRRSAFGLAPFALWPPSQLCCFGAPSRRSSQGYFASEGGCLLLCALLASAGPAAAQSTRETRVLITVVDATGAVLPGATVVVTAIDGIRKGTSSTAIASDQGLATIGALAPGRYSIKA